MFGEYKFIKQGAKRKADEAALNTYEWKHEGDLKYG